MEIETYPILRVTEQGRSKTEDRVVIEFSLNIIWNNRELVTLLCSPAKLEYLSIGFLYSEGLIQSKDEIKNINLDKQKGVVEVATEGMGILSRDSSFRRLIASSGGRGRAAVQHQAKVESQIGISASEVFALMGKFIQRSEAFKATGGVHSAALCDTKGILVFSEDIGRHNAIDKIFGECLWEGIPTDDRIIITSGRVSSEILLKVARRNIPILISKSAPTNLGVKLAGDLGMTLVGFVRGRRMNVYTHSVRILPDGK